MKIRSRICAPIVMGALILLSFPAGLGAQTGTASVRGRVTDPSGAIVPGASVTLTAQSGGMQTATASTDGSYEFKNLTPGAYELAVTAAGFAPYAKMR